MIAIGRTKGPGISRLQDRWGCWTETYEADLFFWVTEAEWGKILWFISPVPTFGQPPEQLTENYYRCRLEPKIKWAGNSTLKQMNVLGPDKEIRRMVFALGDTKFPVAWRPWTLWERTVGYKLSQLKAWWKNGAPEWEDDEDY